MTELDGRSSELLLDVRDLALHFQTSEGKVRALNGIDLSLRRGEIRGIVGETGSGKSVTARAIIGILERNAHVTSGEIFFGGTDLLKGSEGYLQSLRGKDITLVFQDARSALNPVFTVGHQLSRVARFHGVAEKSRRRSRPRHRDAASGPDQRAGAPCSPVPTRAERRDVPAGHDRHGAALLPAADHPGRAHDGP